MRVVQAGLNNRGSTKLGTRLPVMHLPIQYDPFNIKVAFSQIVHQHETVFAVCTLRSQNVHIIGTTLKYKLPVIGNY